MLRVWKNFRDDAACCAGDDGGDDGEQPDGGHRSEFGLVEIHSKFMSAGA